MDRMNLLLRQTSDAYHWTNKMVEDIPLDKWEIIPEVVESNIQWQVGHLIMSFYFHSIMVTRGHQKEVFEHIPLKEYGELFTKAPVRDSLGKVKSNELLSQIKYMQQKSLDVLLTLTDIELDNALEPTRVPHPVAKTKYEAVDWNIKHTMYHCGQIGLIRRIVDSRFDFGLKF